MSNMLRYTLRATLLSLVLGTAHAQMVRTEAGQVEGTTSGGVESWKGIPFVSPPVGPLRWRPPQPARAWRGVLKADSYGHDCMQLPFPSDAAPLGTEPAEDCLTLNVWRPAGINAAVRMPVIVWIHGGGFVNGGSSPPTYAGDALARKGVVFVSFNYRLGRFGTFAFPQLTREAGPGAALGNYSYMDQIAALEWVHRNIAAFGGDSAKVTIMGESAGGISVHALITSPAVPSGLFQRAIIMSGGDATATDPNRLADAERTGIAFANSKGIDPNDGDALAKLRSLSAEDVTDELNLSQLFAPGPRRFSSPFPDGKIAVEADHAYAQGRFTHVPVMIGATSGDIGGANGFMIAGAHRTADMLAAKGVPVYAYRFSYVADASHQPDAKHATDIPFFLDTADAKYGASTSPRDLQTAAKISAYVVNFVRSGNPNGPGLPDWPSFEGGDGFIQDLSDPIR